MAPLTGTDLQRQTLRLYGELVVEREGYAGKLVFTCGEGCSATGLPAAVSIAGGCTLALDPDAVAVKATFRQGGLDFVVNTLNEAMRVLKNEIRKQKPLSVALITPLEATLDEMTGRGVQPDLRIAPSPPTPSPPTPSPPTPSPPTPSPPLANWLAARSWAEVSLPAPKPRDLDKRLLELLPSDDLIRRRWTERIAHYQRLSPGGERVLWLTGAEREALGLSPNSE